MIKGFLKGKQKLFNMINMKSIVGYWCYSDSGTLKCSE